MRIYMPTDISKNEKNPWKMMQLPDILKSSNEIINNAKPMNRNM